jgi:uncharacterized membrane protein YphA (DoxX/SURF4 family)
MRSPNHPIIRSSIDAWRPATLAAFRFCFVYFSLYTLAGQIFGGVFLYPGLVPALGTRWPLRDLTLWTAENIFGATPPIVYNGNSGDTLFHWAQTAWLLTLAIVGTVIWSALDGRRASYAALHKWFRLYLRFALAAQMFYYGMAKIIPTQFPPPALVTLVQPVGDLSLTDLLWVFIGASTPYQIFTGWAEMLAGLLLIVPQTTTLGALVALADMVQVFVLNVSYDFGLKQISFHLILISLFLLAPEFRRLMAVLVLNRPAEASTQPPLFGTARANRLALLAQVAFGLFLIVMFTNLSLRFYVSDGGTGAPRSPLYGIWNVERLAIDGAVRLPLLNDYDRRWRRVIFDFTDRMFFQRWDDSYAAYGVSVDEAQQTLALTKGTSRNWKAGFTYQRPAPDRLILEGQMDGYPIRAELQLVERDTFRLLNSRFRWIRPPDRAGG